MRSKKSSSRGTNDIMNDILSQGSIERFAPVPKNVAVNQFNSDILAQREKRLTKVYSWRKYQIPTDLNTNHAYGVHKPLEPDGSGDNFSHVMNHDYMKVFAKTQM